MSLAKIRDIPNLIKKLGDGEYRIKVKDKRIVIFSKNTRYENEEIKKILDEVGENENWIYLRMWYNKNIKDRGWKASASNAPLS